MRRVQDIADMARRREKDEQQMYARKEQLLQEKYDIERQRDNHDHKLKQKQAKDKEARKLEEFNEMAKKQWHENQMIRKRAEERARQSEMDPYSNVFPEAKEPKQEVHRPTSDLDRRNSREKKPSYDPPKKHSIPQYDPS